MASLEFDPCSTDARKAVVVSFDLCGFSTFCKHPDAHANLPKFISKIFEELDAVLIGFLRGFIEDASPEKGLAPAPEFIKYTGDGALMIWFPPENPDQRQQYCTAIVTAMRRFRQRLAEVIPKWEVEWQIDRLPQPARFGIAAGLVYPLRSPGLGEVVDYAGYCINLAVRLQDHCPEIGFIIHELVFPKLEGLIKYTAHGMKGALSEPVLVFWKDVPAMHIDYIKTKFLPCGYESEARCQATGREYNLDRNEPAVKGTEESPSIAQPRFQAVFEGPGKRMQVFFIDAPYPYLRPVHSIQDSSGKTIGEEVFIYKLISHGPPLVYQFVSKEPHQRK